MTVRLAFVALALTLPLAGCDQPSETRPLDPPKPGTLDPAAAPPAPEGAPAAGAWIILGGERKPLKFLCDGINRPRIIAVLAPGADGKAEVADIDKRDPSQPTVSIMEIGDADPGAGQVYYPLTANGKEAGYLRTFNPGALDDPASATLGTLTSVKLGDDIIECRWVPHGRLLGYTAQRSILISRTAAGAVAYTSFDFKTAARAAKVESGQTRTTTASLDVETGRALPGAPSRYVFDNESANYDVRVGAEAADVVVSLNGVPVETEPFLAWVYAGD